ncbi:hypothetical protein HanRHA438_Chr06g0283661 [Helianthus annuus]|nr:hypothetical protein HanIR_Chr06g0295181 [Helianthus annuus]KAJ0913265.1 hypothetical protein HanRHA438_Chr06g0283661 [Helianthus annuus]
MAMCGPECFSCFSITMCYIYVYIYVCILMGTSQTPQRFAQSVSLMHKFDILINKKIYKILINNVS